MPIKTSDANNVTADISSHSPIDKDRMKHSLDR